MDFDIINAATAFIPVIADGARGLFARFNGDAGAAPQNVEEAVRLREADTARLVALAQLDQVGDTYKWVNAVKGLQRPFVIASVFAAYVYARLTMDVMPPDLVDYTAMVGFYLFGDRVNMYARRRGNA